MKFGTSRKELDKAIKALSGTVKNQENNKIFQIVERKGSIFFETFGDVKIISYKLIADIEDLDGVNSIFMSFDKVSKLIKNMPKAIEHIEVEINESSIEFGQVGGKRRYSLKYADSDRLEYIESWKRKSFEFVRVLKSDFLDCLRKGSVSMAKEGGYVHRSTMLRLDDIGLTVASLDGIRLSACSSITSKLSDDDKIFLLPASTVKELLKVFKNCESIEVNRIGDKDGLSFKGGRIELITKLVDGKFPDYDRIFPTNPNIEIIFKRDELIETLTSLKKMSSPQKTIVDVVNMEYTEKREDVKFWAASNSEDIFSENIEVAESWGSDFEYSLNVDSLLDFLKQTEKDCEIKIEMTSREYPALFKELDSEYNNRFVVMPVIFVKN